MWKSPKDLHAEGPKNTVKGQELSEESHVSLYEEVKESAMEGEKVCAGSQEMTSR